MAVLPLLEDEARTSASRFSETCRKIDVRGDAQIEAPSSSVLECLILERLVSRERGGFVLTSSEDQSRSEGQGHSLGHTLEVHNDWFALLNK